MSLPVKRRLNAVPVAPWENADVQKMYLEGVKWTMKRTEGSTTPHPKVN
jgi:type 1 glutamine amidotransferase